MTETVATIPPTKKERDSNFELLRIVCIIMIVFHHVIIHGEWNLEVLQNNQVLYTVMQFVCFFGKIAVNIFILITGYFLINTKGIKLNKMVKLWLVVLFYSIIMSTLFAVMEGVTYDTEDLVRIFTPVLSSVWWFVTPYFFVLIASPFMNSMIEMVGRKKHLIICVVAIIIQSVISIYLGVPFENAGFIWFITLYLIGAYIGKYSYDFCSVRAYASILVASLIAMAIMAILMVYLGPENEFVKNWIISNKANFGYLRGFLYMFENNIIIVAASLAIFLLFKNIKSLFSPTINSLAMTVFGIYLIHDHIPFREVLYSEIIKCPQYTDPLVIVGVILISVAGILVICGTIEMARIKLFDYIEKHLIMPYLN